MVGAAGATGLFGLGIAMVWVGAEGLVRGAAALGRFMGVSTLVVGLTIVACATSAPELLVSLVAQLRGAGDLAIGNVVGSNIANVGLVLAVCALVRPLHTGRSLALREVPAMVVVSLLALLLGALGGVIGRIDGVLLVLVLTAVLVWMVRSARRDGVETVADVEIPTFALPTAIILTVGGLAVLLVGAEVMTRSGVALARLMHVPELVIGLTLIAVGTSLPELAASIVGVVRGHPDLAVGNVVGSNLMNLTLVLGGVATIRPVTVPSSMFRLELPVMIGLSLAMYLLMRHGRGIGRVAGGGLLSVYIVFLVWLARP